MAMVLWAHTNVWHSDRKGRGCHAVREEIPTYWESLKPLRTDDVWSLVFQTFSGEEKNEGMGGIMGCMEKNLQPASGL